MTNHSNDHDEALLKEIELQYRQASTEMPSRDLDKQIIAAAHREIAKPNPLKRPNLSWWRRLSLPVYATATFAFTAIAAHYLFPEAPRVPPGTSPGSIQIDLTDDSEAPASLPIKARQKRELPEYKSPIVDSESQLEMQKDARENLIEDAKSTNQSASDIQIVPNIEDTNRGGSNFTSQSDINHSAKLEYPKKEVWAREIIELFKNGEHVKAQKELVQFKKIFPDYPIDAQVEAIKSM